MASRAGIPGTQPHGLRFSASCFLLNAEAAGGSPGRRSRRHSRAPQPGVGAAIPPHRPSAGPGRASPVPELSQRALPSRLQARLLPHSRWRLLCSSHGKTLFQQVRSRRVSQTRLPVPGLCNCSSEPCAAAASSRWAQTACGRAGSLARSTKEPNVQHWLQSGGGREEEKGQQRSECNHFARVGMGGAQLPRQV